MLYIFSKNLLSHQYTLTVQTRYGETVYGSRLEQVYLKAFSFKYRTTWACIKFNHFQNLYSSNFVLKHKNVMLL